MFCVFWVQVAQHEFSVSLQISLDLTISVHYSQEGKSYERQATAPLRSENHRRPKKATIGS